MPGSAASVPATRSLADRWLAWRNRLLRSKRFQRHAAVFPLTRPIARRRASALFDLVAGFVYSQVLLACVRLRLFDMLAEGPQTLAVLARRVGLTEAAAERLLQAAVPLQLVERCTGQRFALGVLGATMVGNGALAAMVEHHAALYADLADPVALLRRNGHHELAEADPARSALAQYWPYARQHAPRELGADQVSAYSGLMSASQPLVADEVLAAWPLARHRCLLDIGGGEGTFLSYAAQRAPKLELMLFDLPAVAERARIRFAASGLTQRARCFGGDFLQDALPTGADIATLIRVVHDHDDASVRALLQAVHRALAPGGTLLLAEPMAGTAGAEAMGDAYFGFYLMAMGQGRPRTAEQLTGLLRQAGFQDIHLLRNSMPLQTRILSARVGVNFD